MSNKSVKLFLVILVVTLLIVGIIVWKEKVFNTNSLGEAYYQFFAPNKLVLTNITPKPLILQKYNNRIAIVFAYINEPMPSFLKERLTGKNWYSSTEFRNNFTGCTEKNHCFLNNFYYLNDWGQREAAKYNQAFGFYKIDMFRGDNEIFDSEIGIPEDNPGSFNFVYPSEFYKRVFIRYPALKQYKYLSVIIYNSDFMVSTNNLLTFEHWDEGTWGEGDEEAWTWVKPEWGKFHSIQANVFRISLSPEEYGPLREQERQAFLRSWMHEFFHIFGATDKYETTPDRACLIDQATGQEYDSHDIMCHRIPTEGGGFSFQTYRQIDEINDLIISEPTAREIGWR